MTALPPGIFCFWVRAAYNLQLVSYDLKTVSNSVSKTPRVLVHRLLGLLFTYFGCGMLVEPHPVY